MSTGEMVDKLAAIVLKDKKVLFARSRGKAMFYILGGKREQGETDVQALDREMLEEAGARFKPESIHHVVTLLGPCHGRPPEVKLQLTCYGGTLESEPAPSSEIEEFKWLSTADKDEAYMTDMGRLLLDALKEKGLIS